MSELEFPSSNGSIYVNSRTDSRTICSYDLLSVHWNITRDISPSEHSIAFTINGDREVTYGSLAVETGGWLREEKKGTLKCALESEFCRVGFQNATVTNGKLVLSFDRDTDEIPLLTASAVKVSCTLPPIVRFICT